MGNIVIFGAGTVGKEALIYYGKRVAFFADNNPNLWETNIQGILVKKIDDIARDAEQYCFVIANADMHQQKEMKIQLESLGIKKIVCFQDDWKGYFVSTELVVNPYKEKITAENKKGKITDRIQIINQKVDKIVNQNLLFDHVEIETVNRCNGVCAFCPVNKNADSREYIEMSQDLFESIIQQLADIDYSGKLALFSNNEPFLDKDILAKHKHARDKLPNARMHLFTNGTLLNIDLFIELMRYLDELIIDNYQQDLKLIKPCREIKAYCEEHPELKNRVTIVLRKPNEVLTTRGGEAPNKKDMISYPDAKCLNPFKQLIIRPDGKVSLCCNDPLGKNTLGDLMQSTILEVWHGDAFKKVRQCLGKGRANWKQCIYCDVFNLV